MTALFPAAIAPSNVWPNSRVPWSFAVACCLYYLLAGRILIKVIPIFATLFDGIGVQLPLATRLLMVSRTWGLPLLFGGATVLTIARQIFPLGKIPRRAANVFLVFVGVALTPLVMVLLYLPLFELILETQAMR